MARFQPGQDKPKNSGRKPGVPNRKTQSLEDSLASLNFSVPEQLVRLLPNLNPDKQADVLLDLMSFLFPRRKAIEQILDAKITAQPQVEQNDTTLKEKYLKLADIHRTEASLCDRSDKNLADAYIRMAENHEALAAKEDSPAALKLKN